MHLDHRSIVANPVDDALDSSGAKGAGSKIRQFLTPKRGHFPTSQITPPNYPEASASSPHRTLLGLYFHLSLDCSHEICKSIGAAELSCIMYVYMYV